MSTVPVNPGRGSGALEGLRVVEYGDENVEYCGMVLAGLGAEIIKVEPPGGSRTREIGPFVHDVPNVNSSLHFWHYNRGKKSVVVDLEHADGAGRFRALVGSADVFLESTPNGYLEQLGLGSRGLLDEFPQLVVARVTPFGDNGPWSHFAASDLVHLALGGVVMNCGYDPDPRERYDLPPIAPQMWHAYHVAGDQVAYSIVAALLYRARTGRGQLLSCSVHEAVSKCTEVDLMSWVMRRVTLRRQTCRHARETITTPIIAHTKDGRWFMNFAPPADAEKFVANEGIGVPAADAEADDQAAGGIFGARSIPGTEADSDRAATAADLVQRLGRRIAYADVPWLRAQDQKLMWAPLRLPHENLDDEHWRIRGTFAEIEHPEHGVTATYPVSRWLSSARGWVVPGRAPLLGEHTDKIATTRSEARLGSVRDRVGANAEPRSALGKPFPLAGVRILDFSWFLASAGGTRFLASLGAEVIKVEWKGNPDTRMGAMAPVGGREARRAAKGPLPPVTDPDMGGQFNLKNSGKRGISLNVRHPKGLQIAKQLVKVSDAVTEGFSPTVMDRWGLGYPQLRELRPDIVYVQQSGMGKKGAYGSLRTIGPIAASLVGTSEMSGLPSPAAPAGWGYSYLDWTGAYNFTLAVLVGLFHRERTGEGQWIDASQCEAGLFITGTALPDWSVNRRPFSRYGNRSPYKRGAPHGIYRCAGNDRWLAIACFTEEQWRAVCRVASLEHLLDDPEFATLGERLRHQDRLDAAVSEWTATIDAYDGMMALQGAGVAAGACQSAEDRCDNDPQLAALGWLTEVTGTKIGTWPLPELPVRFDQSPSYIGGPIDRGAPCYGEDNRYVFGELLNMSERELEELEANGVI